MQPVPMFGSGVYGKSAVVTRQRRLNCYYELRPDKDKNIGVVIYGTPGLKPKFNLGTSPVRAWLGTQTALYLVIGQQFESVDQNGAVIFSATIGTSSGLASIAINPAGNQVVVVDGSGGWVYQPLAGTFNPLPTGSWFTPGAVTVTNVAGYFVCDVPGTSQFSVSNINDATSGNALSVGSAQSYPDLMVGVDGLQGNLLTFFAEHLEFWQNIGNSPPGQPFAAIQSAATQWGLAAPFSRATLGDTLLYLGQTPTGVRRVCQVNGYGVTQVSDEIDAIINAPGFVFSDAVALAYQRDKHPLYQLTFPTMNRSFLLDLSTGIFGETQTGLTSQYAQRHQGNLSVYTGGQLLVSDFQNGNVYTFDDNTFSDNGQVLPFEVVTKHHVKGFNRFRVPMLYLDMEVGVGNANAPNPQISIECSKDSGKTWLAPRILPLGQVGQYVTRVAARRFGRSRVFTWRFRITDPVKRVIVAGAIQTKGRPETK